MYYLTIGDVEHNMTEEARQFLETRGLIRSADPESDEFRLTDDVRLADGTLVADLIFVVASLAEYGR